MEAELGGSKGDMGWLSPKGIAPAPGVARSADSRGPAVSGDPVPSSPSYRLGAHCGLQPQALLAGK